MWLVRENLKKVDLNCFHFLGWPPKYDRSLHPGVYICTHQVYICTHKAYICTYQVCICTHKVYFCTHQAYICTHQAYICTHQPYICTHQVYMCTHQAYICAHQAYIWTHQAYICTHQVFDCTHLYTHSIKKIFAHDKLFSHRKCNLVLTESSGCCLVHKFREFAVFFLLVQAACVLHMCQNGPIQDGMQTVAKSMMAKSNMTKSKMAKTKKFNQTT